MNAQMMDGLLGASSNIRLAGTPMNVYREASAEGDTEKMKRALGYAGECTEKAAGYREKLDEGIKAKAEAEREKAKLEQEAAERERPKDTDQVQISAEARAAQAGGKPPEALNAPEPVIYTPDGKAVDTPGETEANLSFTA